MEDGAGIEPALLGFAGRCLSSWLPVLSWCESKEAAVKPKEKIRVKASTAAGEMTSLARAHFNNLLNTTTKAVQKAKE